MFENISHSYSTTKTVGFPVYCRKFLIIAILFQSSMLPAPFTSEILDRHDLINAAKALVTLSEDDSGFTQADFPKRPSLEVLPEEYVERRPNISLGSGEDSNGPDDRGMERSLELEEDSDLHGPDGKIKKYPRGSLRLGRFRVRKAKAYMPKKRKSLPRFTKKSEGVFGFKSVSPSVPGKMVVVLNRHTMESLTKKFDGNMPQDIHPEILDIAKAIISNLSREGDSDDPSVIEERRAFKAKKTYLKSDLPIRSEIKRAISIWLKNNKKLLRDSRTGEFLEIVNKIDRVISGGWDNLPVPD